MIRTHTFNLVHYEHFKNLPLSNKEIQFLIYQEFNFIQWLIARLSINPHSSDQFQLGKFYAKLNNSTSLAYFIQNKQINRSQKHYLSTNSIQNTKVTLKAKPYPYNILIFQELSAENHYKSPEIYPKIYQIYSTQHKLFHNTLEASANLIDKNIFLKQPNNQLIAKVRILFKSQISSSNSKKNINSHQRDHIQMSVYEQCSLQSFQSIIPFLCQFMQADYQRQFLRPNLPLKPVSDRSFLSLQQGNCIRQIKADKIVQSFDKKGFEFVFRKFDRMTTKKQLATLLLSYSNSVNKQLVSKDRHENMKKNYNSEQLQAEDRFPSKHFVCTLSNALVPFVLSFCSILSPEKQQSYLMRYVEILYPSYNDYFKTNKKGEVEVRLSDSKFKEIKKAIGFIINKVILQYADEITLLAAQLSFIFQIIELLNQSLLTKELIDQLLLFLYHYGGLYPEILLNADQWVTELKDQVIAQIKLNQTSSKQKSHHKNVWYELNKIISPGRLTRFKKKVYSLIQEILHQVKLSKSITFYDHYKSTSNALTIIAFDITSHTVRFFNHLTTPNMNILHFLFLQQNFQCVQLPDKWTPYKIVYQNDTFFINLQKFSLTAPIGIQYIEQYLDNLEIRKRYFDFSTNYTSSTKNINYTRRIMLGCTQRDKNYDDRLTQFRLKRYQIVSVIKKLLFQNIPKTKLIWRFIRYEKSSPDSNQTTQPSQSTINVLRKIQIINHVYNLVKTLISHQKNVNREVWLQSQCNLVDQVKTCQKNFIFEGQQNEILDWEIERICQLKKVFNEQFKVQTYNNLQKKSKKELLTVKSCSDYVEKHILNRIKQNFPDTDFLSESERYSIIQNLNDKMKNLIEKIVDPQSHFGGYQQKVEQILLSALKKINTTRQTITQLFSGLQSEMLRQIQTVEKEFGLQLTNRFQQIQKQQVQCILQLIDEQIIYLKKFKSSYFQINNQAEFTWFKIQSNNQKIIQSILLRLSNSILIDPKDLMIKMYKQCGVKDVQTYDNFQQNFYLIQRKISHTINHFQNQQSSHHNLHQIKINLVMDSNDNSELFISLYLRLLFIKLQKNHPHQYILKFPQSNQVNYSELFTKKQLNSTFTLESYFDSFTCTSFQSISILELILQNNFSKTFSISNCNQILLKIPAYKHLLSWTSFDQVQNLFNDFNWFLIEQDEALNFYKNIYTTEYKNQLIQRSQIDQTKLDQIKNLLSTKTHPPKSQNSIFAKQRNKSQQYLVYEILEEWIENLQRKTSIDHKQLTLDQIVNNKLFYNNKVLESYSTLEKKQVINFLKKYIEKFATIIQELLSVSIDTIPHSSNQWKSIILKNALSGRKLKAYIQQLLQSYHLNPNLTFQELMIQGKHKFHGLFNIILWNCRKKSVQICNFLTKPKMPIWFAILSACTQPFYMKEQPSHKTMQISQNIRLSSTFHQFPQNRSSTLIFRQSLLGQLKQTTFEKAQSKNIDARYLGIEVQKNSRTNVNALVKKAWITPPIIDQQVNTYLSPGLFQSFPIGYLTNQNFGLIQRQNFQSPCIISICFKKKSDDFCERIKKNIFDEKEINLSPTGLLGLSFNKKDKKLQILKQYLRKIIKESHFSYFFQTIMEDNRIKYRSYKNQHQNTIEQISQESVKISDDFTSLTPNDRDKLSPYQIQNNDQKECVVHKIRISQVSVQGIDQYGDITNLNQKKTSQPYKFYPTFEQAHKVKQVEEGPLSSKQLFLDFNDNVRKSQHHQNQGKTHEKKQKMSENKQKKNLLKRIYRRFILSCICFDSQKHKQQG